MTAKARMISWLERHIQEADFVEMRRLGVNTVRVPCGYWNWISYEGQSTPNAPEADDEGFPVVAQLRNLQSIATPADYLPFFDKVFDFAMRNDIRVMLDLHGLPGSQNGEIHSGVLTSQKEKDRYYFDTEWNRQRAVEAVAEMAKYAAGKQNLYGIQVINEPRDKISHDALSRYYSLAISEARKHLDSSVPVVLFSWTYDFANWSDSDFPSESCGNIVWDTHIYHHGSGSLQEVKRNFWNDIQHVRKFAARGHSVVVGEWTVAGVDKLSESNNASESEIHHFAAWFVRHIEGVAQGSICWNFDGPGRWGFRNVARCVDWPAIFSDQYDQFRLDFSSCGLRCFHGTWLSASKEGVVTVKGEKSQWEEWVPHVYMSGGCEKVALQSWHGKWLSADKDGKLCASADRKSAWEEFTPHSYKDGAGDCKMALQSFHGKWLKVKESGEVSATADSHSKREELSVVY
eukprot:TRINITY_DN47162_c0_g1_i1.p1 TRINITY_DN47162_c0_g1~~TRINITY_DN47162_c0_g1_i1.p1  ORF type:complete len:525 (-),score=80.96 TRINITY_DN47162_c0_g1_i1:152-1531(-)